MNAPLGLFEQALWVALVLTLPVIATVGCIGVLIGLLQTLFQIQDQNVSFGPKVAALAALIWVGGLAGLTLLESLLQSVLRSLPALASS